MGARMEGEGSTQDKKIALMDQELSSYTVIYGRINTIYDPKDPS